MFFVFFYGVNVQHETFFTLQADWTVSTFRRLLLAFGAIIV
jgi:hypothetical protein